MEENNKNNEIQKLVDILKKASDNYYSEFNSEEDTLDFLDDETYDEIENRLKELDPENDWFKSIGKVTVENKNSHFKEKEHTLMMGSQNKSHNIDELNKKFIKNLPKDKELLFMVDEKADGSSAAITFTKDKKEILNNINEVYEQMKYFLTSKKRSDSDIKLKILEENKTNLINQVNSKKEEEFGLLSVVSRGNGVIGEDMTLNGYKFQKIPKNIDLKEVFKTSNGKLLNIDNNEFKIDDIKRIEVRGEVIIKEDDYNSINTTGKYKNMRNAASGIMRRQNGEHSEKLSILAYDLLLVDNEDHTITLNQDTRKEFLKKMEFETTNYFYAKSLKEIEKEYETYKKTKRKSLDYLIDGLVIKANDWELSEELGVTNQKPNGEIALKFEHQIKMSAIKDIKYYFGKSGIITPVGFVEPINIEGSTIENATLSNKKRLYGMLLKKGTPVMVSKRGDVIPKIEENMDPNLQLIYAETLKVIQENIFLLNDDEKSKLITHINNNNYEFKLEINNILLSMKVFSQKEFLKQIDETFLNNNLFKNNIWYEDMKLEFDHQTVEDVKEDTFIFPTKCPKCSSPLLKDNSYYKCNNENCSGVKIGKVIKFTEDLDGLGEGIINQLYDNGLINDISDLFKLTKEDDFKVLTKTSKQEIIKKYMLENFEKVIKKIFLQADVKVDNFEKLFDDIIIEEDKINFVFNDEASEYFNFNVSSFNKSENKFYNYNFEEDEMNFELSFLSGSEMEIYITEDLEEFFDKVPEIEKKYEFIDGWQKTKVNNFIKSIKKMKEMKDYELFGGLGFSQMGKRSFQNIFQNLSYNELLKIKDVHLDYDELNDKNFHKVLQNTKTTDEIKKIMEKVYSIEGVGEKTTVSLINELSVRHGEVMNLIDNYIRLSETSIIDQNIKKYVVSVTGKINALDDKFKDRKTFEKYLKELGHTVSSPSGKTNYVITDSPKEAVSGNSKYEKGLKLEAQRSEKVVVTSKEFFSILESSLNINSNQNLEM